MIIALVLYNLALLLLSPVILLYLLWLICCEGKSRRGFLERLGFISGRKLAGTAPRIWLHAVSVGETAAAKPIWPALLDALPGWALYHSTTTDTGQGEAVKAVGDRGQVIYFPFDFLPCVWLALFRVRPKLIVLVETELWPNFLAVARLLGVKIMIVNGRISDRSLRGAARLAPLYRWMTAHIGRFCMQSPTDAERIISMGADPARVVVVGNSKFDQTFREVPLGEQVTLRDAIGLRRDEPIVLAGSTHRGEEESVLRAFRQVKTSMPQLRLVIAPRDIQRAQEIEELVAAHGFAASRRTTMAKHPPAPDAVIILDTIGELARAYALCSSAFVGGSLVPHGGQNVLEPLALGKAAIFGPYMDNFRDIANLVQQAGVGFLVNDAEELAKQWKLFLKSAQRRRQVAELTREVFRQHQGASRRCAEEAARLVSASPAPAAVTPSPSDAS
ncbi:MAG: 3-deoxy-D-manno-octulosonic acid transferase [Armatimonadota bacterium]